MSTALQASRSPAAVSLWWAPLDVCTAARRALEASLNADELRRADRFHRPLDRERFVTARGWLRRLLATQLGCAPEEIQIVLGEHGKPRLAGAELFFNAARSAGLALYATSSTIEVGVDIEEVRVDGGVDGIATRFFSSTERRALASVPPRERLAAGFECWAFKEAYAKGIGAGLTLPLQTVDVWVGAGRPSVVHGWSVHPVAVAPGFAAAVAAASPRWPPPGGNSSGVRAEPLGIEIDQTSRPDVE
ncbi:MAG: 4'-phosphopantetheinyl transferase family protein [Solirubrobacteraceae bacterium]